MQVLLCAINAKYIHSNLAILYLHQIGRSAGFDTEICEFSINEPIGYILSELLQHRPDVVAFSCYIWNIEMVLKLCADIKKINPRCPLVLGGPEVSFCAAQILSDNPGIDYVVCGEGEAVWPGLLTAIEEGRSNPNLPGVAFRSGQVVAQNSLAPTLAMDELPYPYEGISQRPGQILYYESSRGCPFNCSYCVSSLQSGVRFMSLERVKADLQRLNALKPLEIKFVDRSFNCDQKRAREIMEFLAGLPGQTRFHMEIEPQLLNPAFLDFLERLPQNRFAFEIGVQSTHDKTLKAINRKGDWEKISANIRRLRQAANIHLHLDLIAGLPEEDYSTFKNSFNQVYATKPHHLQLGFLKLLPGTRIRLEAESGQYQFQSHPPYEVLSNRWISYEELVRLHHIEDVVEKYYNAGLAEATLEEIITCHYNGDAFSFWERLGEYWYEEGYYGIGTAVFDRYSILKRFLERQHPQAKQKYHDLLKYDLLKGRLTFALPEGFNSDPECSEILHMMLKQNGFIDQYLPELKGQSAREIKKRVIMERFMHLPQSHGAFPHPRLLLFVYSDKNRPASRVTEIDPGNLSRH